MTDRQPEAVRVRLLGDFSVRVGSRVVDWGEWRLRKAATLVQMLGLAKDHRLHRERIMAALWPDLGKSRPIQGTRRWLRGEG